jgi:hypothetical protein
MLRSGGDTYTQLEGEGTMELSGSNQKKTPLSQVTVVTVTVGSSIGRFEA